MNLTFYQNNKEKENINLFTNYNFYQRKKPLLFPSIFSNFETEKIQPQEISPKKIKTKVYLPIYRNIKTEILKMKNEVNSLYNIKNSIFKHMKSRFNSVIYKNFVKGFGKYFFGPFGVVTKRYKLLKEYYTYKSTLNTRIYAGKLLYYNFPIKKFDQVTARQNEVKKRRLSLSTNFAVVFDKNDIISAKAETSKRLVKPKKNYVDINRNRYLSPDLQQIKEEHDVNKFKNKNKIKLKKKMNLYLNTNSIINRIKNEHKKSNRDFTFITEYNKNVEYNHLHKNLAPKTAKRNLINFSLNKSLNKKPNLFLTQNNFNTKL